MEEIKHFILPEHTNELYKKEAISSISLTKEVASKINELVDAYNELNKGNLAKIHEQDGKIRKGILYMKDNLINSLNDLMDTLKNEGFVDKRIQDNISEVLQNVGILSQRLDNLIGTVKTGSTTLDAEIIDGRVGIDGITYNTFGEALRTQLNNLINEIYFYIGSLQKEFVMFNTHSQDGYLALNNGVLMYRGTEEYHSKSTLKIPCKKGDEFTYNGIGRNSTLSYVLFNNDVIVNTGQYEGSTTVVIPNNVNYILFSSFDVKDNEVVLEVKYKSSKVYRVETERKITELQKRNNIFDITEQLGYLYIENGVLSYKGLEENHSKTTSKIPCKKGESFLYNGIGRSSTISWVMYKDDEIITTGQYSGSTIVTVPDEVNYIMFSSFNTIENDVVLNISFLNENNVDVTTGNVLLGKKYVACGDSFTIGDFNNSLTNDFKFTDGLYIGENKTYPYFIGRRNNMIVINEAIGGSTMTNITGRNPFSVDRYKNIPSDADYITIKFGINDSNQSATIGTINDTNNTTFYGAWNQVLDYLTTNFPYAKIGVIVTNGSKLPYVEATKEVAKKWGIPYIDLATDPNLPLMLRTNRTDVISNVIEKRNKAFSVNYDGDSSGNNKNWHPNELAHEFESTIIENWLRSL